MADKHVLFRECLRDAFESSPTIRILQHFSDSQEAAEHAVGCNADVLLLGIRTYGTNSFDAARWAKKERHNLKVIFLTDSTADEHVYEAINLGAHGYVNKNCPRNELQLAIEKVHRGEKYIPMAERFVSNPRRIEGIYQLTKRERQVLKLLAEGNTVKEAAILMDLSAKTIEVHKYNVFKKLNIHNKVQLVIYAISHKVLTVEAVT